MYLQKTLSMLSSALHSLSKCSQRTFQVLFLSKPLKINLFNWFNFCNLQNFISHGFFSVPLFSLIATNIIGPNCQYRHKRMRVTKKPTKKRIKIGIIQWVAKRSKVRCSLQQNNNQLYSLTIKNQFDRIKHKLCGAH